jgi:hypothetical protein
VITGEQTAIVGRQLRAVNRRGRPVNLRVTVTALQTGSDLPGGALILMEDVSEVEPTDEAEQ